MSLLLAVLIIAVPLLPALAALATRFLPRDTGPRAVAAAATAGAASALLAAALLPITGPVSLRWAPAADAPALLAGVGLRLDVIAAVVVVLVAFLGAVVLRFSLRYLSGDAGRRRFFSWMGLTLGAVLTLVLSGHLLLLWVAWVATSLCLHRLLLHYPDRPGALFSARKKFVVSRLGDAALLAAIVLIYRQHGTLELDSIFTAVTLGHTGGLLPISLLIALCAMLKSAQFPFHSWLPDTMETPTPVSAFMHAGIVNAGGFLLIRLSPLLTPIPVALHLVAAVGAVTAAFGAVVMLAQPSVKRALAFSTIAQMGFMMLQCGLGAFGLALLHLVAHSLYKAHAFLRAGSTIGAVPRAAIPLRTPAIALGVLGGTLLVAGGATAFAALAPTGSSAPAVLLLVLALALGYGLARQGSARFRAAAFTRAVAVATAITLASFALHIGAGHWFSDLPAVTTPPALLAFIGAVFVGLFGLQALLWRASDHPLGRRLYVHALNGFYLGTLANRWLGLLWPRHPVIRLA